MVQKKLELFISYTPDHAGFSGLNHN